MLSLPGKAKKPTLYFIGVTTSQSSIMKLFPRWMEELNLEAELKGIDIEIHAAPEIYRQVVDFIKNDELSLGALVTTHKIDLLNASRDMFDYIEKHASQQEELSCISKRKGLLEGSAKDPISSGLALQAFVPDNYWKNHGGELLIIGAGGSARAISSILFAPENRDNIPSKLIINNRSKPRLDKFKKLFTIINPDISVEYNPTPEPEDNDKVLQELKPYSLVVNATGLGKDRPGSPLTDNCQFPANSLIWELNYRGDLKFMHQALAQKEDKNLYIEDGWTYFIHGWTEVIKEVFHIEIDEQTFANLEKIAFHLKN